VAEKESAVTAAMTTIEVRAADTIVSAGEKARRSVPSSDQLTSDGPDRVLVRMSADDDEPLDDAVDAVAPIRDGQKTTTPLGEDEKEKEEEKKEDEEGDEDEEEELSDDDSWYANRNRVKYVEEWLRNNAVANSGRYDDQRPWWIMD